jgi:hypothetical protein
MYFQMGSVTRPLNEVKASVAYQPKYSLSRLISEVVETWTIQGVIILEGDLATPTNMSAEINIVNQMMDQFEPDLFILDDDGGSTPWALFSGDCLTGPTVVDFAWTTGEKSIYPIMESYQAIVQATRVVGAGLIAFTESLTPEPGGREHVWVGGAINQPEQQIAAQYKTWRVRQSGSAIGLLGYPTPPPAIWPFALVRPASDGWASAASPRRLGKNYDTEFEISWNYEFEWHQPLFGQPNRIYL